MTATRPESKLQILARGFRRRCPNCDQAPLFRAYLKPVDKCVHCGEAFGHIRADDFPPYLTMVLVGHIVVPLLLIAEDQYAWSMGLHAAVWLPLTVVLMAVFLPRLKGMVLAWMWALGLTGNETQGVEAGE